MSRKIVLGVVAVVSAATCAFLIVVLVGKGLAQAGMWAAPLGALAGIVAAAAAVWVLAPRPSNVPLPPELEVPQWVVGRPAELGAIVKALAHDNAGTVGITTGLYGAGGFGKTTLARMVCADSRVRRRFEGRMYVVTVGRDVRGAAAIAAKVNDVIKLVSGEDAAFADPDLAGRRLGALLDAGPRRLLVLDDVWASEQLAPFAEGGKRCARLVTTRVPELLAGRGTAVRVDQMSQDQARAMLTFGLPPLDLVVVQELLAVTGRWPLLVRLVSKILADYAQLAPDVSARGAELLERLRTGGPAVVDDLLGDAGSGLDVGKPQERARAVRATIGASTNLLDGHDAARFAELGVFAEDEIIPFSLVVRLWRATAGLDELQGAQVCRRLVQLALVSQATGPIQGIVLHDVIRDFVRAELGQQRLARLNVTMLNAVAADLPASGPLVPDAADAIRVAWWELGQDRYLWDHLIEHLVDAGRRNEADAVAGDLRWVGARLERFGPAAPAADLSAAGTPRAARLRAAIVRAGHLLSPAEPTGAVVDILHSRVADDRDWGPQVTALRDICPRPRLVSRWPLPDLAGPALRRVLTGRADVVWALAVAADGNWLATGGLDETVRVWDVASGQERATLTGHTNWVEALAVAPDGSWLASGGADGTVRIWDVASGQERAALTGRHSDAVEALAVAPDGSWLASGGADGTVRIWDVASGQERAALTGHTDGVAALALAVAPDGSWLATGGADGTVQIWDMASGQERATLTSHTNWAAALAVAPDGSWLATGGGDAVRIWDMASGQQRATLTGHTDWVEAVAPDGSWLAASCADGTVRIWDVASGQERATLTGHTYWAAAAVAPDGSWLAASSGDGVRIWDVASGQERAALTGHTNWAAALAVAPDGSWLATSGNGTVRIWDTVSGQERAALTSHTNWTAVAAVAPDGSWLAASCADGTVRIWDVASGQERATLPGPRPRSVAALAMAPDGSWLAINSNGTVRIWDTATGLERAALTGPSPRSVEALAVAPDGSWLATGGWNGVRIWDVATAQERATLPGPRREKVVALAVAPDGSWLAASSNGGTVRIWDISTGQGRAILTGHTDWAEAMAVAPDGNWLATSSWDGTVRIWEVATGLARAVMRLDDRLDAPEWLGSNVLAVRGAAGLYLFDFLTPLAAEPSPVADGVAGRSRTASGVADSVAEM